MKTETDKNYKGLVLGEDGTSFFCKFCQRNLAFWGYQTLDQHVLTTIHISNKSTFPERLEENLPSLSPSNVCKQNDLHQNEENSSIFHFD